MAQSLLTPSVITKEALAILHQKCNFIGNIDRQYDKRFAQAGAKIGNDLQIRKPNQFAVRTGATIDVQDISEESVTLTQATQKGVDFTFTSEELTMHIDDFKERYLEPAVSVLAANVEADAFNMYKDVWNFYDGVDSADSFANLTQGMKLLSDNLSPLSQRCGILPTQSTVDILADTKGLFQDSSSVSKQYLEGALGRISGFDLFENTITPSHTTGTAAETDTVYNVNGANQSGATLVVDGGTTTFLVGDIITITGCNAVHPETKVSTGKLKQFVITANSGATATSLAISPSIVLSGAKQNVSAAPTDDGLIAKHGGGNAADWQQDIFFHKSAFAFVSADLEDVSKYGAWGAREVMDNISMRIARQYDIVNDKFPCRIDVLYGYKAVRPELAARVGHN